VTVAARRDGGGAGAGRSFWIRLLYGGSVFVCAALLIESWLGLLGSMAGSWGLALFGGLLGVLAADCFTGGVHWACDTWGDEETPLVGAGLIADFREHHRDPEAMLAHSWVVVNGEPALAAALALGLLALPPLRQVWVEHPGVWAFSWCFALFGASANQLHQWAHAKSPPRIVRVLQGMRFVLSPSHHARHHRHPNTDARAGGDDYEADRYRAEPRPS